MKRKRPSKTNMIETKFEPVTNISLRSQIDRLQDQTEYLRETFKKAKNIQQLPMLNLIESMTVALATISDRLDRDRNRMAYDSKYDPE